MKNKQAFTLLCCPELIPGIKGFTLIEVLTVVNSLTYPTDIVCWRPIKVGIYYVSYSIFNNSVVTLRYLAPTSEFRCRVYEKGNRWKIGKKGCESMAQGITLAYSSNERFCEYRFRK